MRDLSYTGDIFFSLYKSELILIEDEQFSNYFEANYTLQKCKKITEHCQKKNRKNNRRRKNYASRDKY